MTEIDLHGGCDHRCRVLFRSHILLSLCKDLICLPDYFRSGSMVQQVLAFVHEIFGNGTDLCKVAVQSMEGGRKWINFSYQTIDIREK